MMDGILTFMASWAPHAIGVVAVAFVFFMHHSRRTFTPACVVGLGAAFVAFGATEMLTARHVRDWPLQVNGARVKKSIPVRFHVFSWRLTYYEYEVAGKTYSGKVSFFCDSNFRYPADATFDIHVNPLNPTASCIETTSKLMRWIILLVGIVSVLIGCYESY